MIITLSVSTDKVGTKSQAMKNTLFDVREFDTSSKSLLEEIFTTHNYSSNIWVGGRCLNKNFEHMTGVILDVDQNLSIAAAKELFKDVNYVIHTSTSHQVDIARKGGVQERFRIILPFEINDYFLVTSEQILTNVYSSLLQKFPFIDASCKDPARKYFPFLNHNHPSLFELIINDVGKWFKLNPGDVLPQIGTSIDLTTGNTLPEERNKAVLLLDDEVVCSDKKTRKIRDIKVKTPCKCIFHEDSTASAFIEILPNRRKMLICTADGCRKKAITPTIDVYPELFYLGDQLYKVFEQEATVDIDKVNQKYLLKLHNEERENLLYELTQLTIPRTTFHIQREVDGYSEKMKWSLQHRSGLLQVTYAPISVKVKDNAYINNWLESLFGEHTAFIKQWLAIYCYANYTKLPMIVLPGPRDTGKSTFAEFIAGLYLGLGCKWSGEKEQFNPEYQKHLLIADEAAVEKREQYSLIKDLSGSEYLRVNEKHLPMFEIRNNLCFILLTNSTSPLFLVERERPKGIDDNQFFMWETPVPKRRNALIKYDLADRSGYFVRTELREIFEEWKKAKEEYRSCRYSIHVPVTPLLQRQYRNSRPQIEYDAEEVWKICIDGGEFRDKSGNLVERIGPFEYITVTEIGKIMKVLGIQTHCVPKAILGKLQVMGLISNDAHYIKKDRVDSWKVFLPIDPNKEAQ